MAESPHPAYFVKTRVKCIDQEIGRLLAAYLFDGLHAKQKMRFERHLEKCIACATDVINWNNLKVTKGD